MAIHSMANSTPISRAYHHLISGFYGSGSGNLQFMNDPRFAGFGRLRDYIQTLNWEQQWRWGYEVYIYVLRNGNLQGFDPNRLGLP